MDWWRAYHGLPNDPKLALVAAATKLQRHVTPRNATRGEVLAVWVSLLDLASQNAQRGSIEGFDTEQIAWMLEMPQEDVSDIIDGLRKKGCISGNTLTSWDKRNPKRERDDNSLERVRKHREKQSPDTVTPRNATKRLEERRGEEKRDKHKGADAPTVRATRDRFSEFIEPWPRVANPDHAARCWLSCIDTPADEGLAFAARDRYLSSDEVSRGVVMDPAKFLMEQKNAKWAGKWPTAKNGSNGTTPYRKDDYHA